MQNPLTSLTHRERFGLAVAVAVLSLFGIGSTLWRSQAAPLEPTTTFAAEVRPTNRPTAPPTPATPPSPKPLTFVVIYVSGAVKKPGIYTLPQGARLHQAIQKAGGFGRGAQEDALNLAGFLQDADQVHVPLKQESSTPTSTRVATSNGQGRVLGKQATTTVTPTHTQTSLNGGKFHTPGEGHIKLNSAPLEELQRLPGVGPSTAQSIVDYRQQHGSFQELEELKEVRGIGEKKFAKMEPFLTL